ncbi:MAG: GNAT family N-acetyltransferase [Defluviitaleaceae bacterium]|nr:GNAT family N-acetyltransferase [Defluviitaleaceae bacterium]
MIKLHGKDIYLAPLEKEHCRALVENAEYDFDNPTQYLYLGYSRDRSDGWYDDIQKMEKEGVNVRVGIFLNDGTPIGDVALQSISWRTRSCTMGIGIERLAHRGRGYGKAAMGLLIGYAFDNMGLSRIGGETWENNIAMQKAFESQGFQLEGRARRAEYFGGKYLDVFHYGLLAEDWRKNGLV